MSTFGNQSERLIHSAQKQILNFERYFNLVHTSVKVTVFIRYFAIEPLSTILNGIKYGDFDCNYEFEQGLTLHDSDS